MTTLDLRGADVEIAGTVGTDVEVSITFTDSAGTAVDVSGYTAVADVLRNGTSVETFTDAVSGAGSNVLTLTLTDTQTTTIGNERNLTWRLSMTSGTVTEHWIAGDFRLYTAGHPKASSGSSSATVTVTGAITATVNVTTALSVLDARYAPLSGVGPILQPASGQWVAHDAPGSGSVVLTLGTMHVWPLSSPLAFTADRIGCWLTAVQASSLVRLGVYANGTDDRPGDLLFDAGTLDASTTTGAREITISQDIPAGVIWMAVAVQGAAGTTALLRYQNVTPRLPTTNSANALGDMPVTFTRASVTGALPTSFGAATSYGLNSAAIIALRRA